MTLNDILLDIYTLEDEMRTYERKCGFLSKTFYESYAAGEEPPDDAWVRDWTAWASAYKLWLRRRGQYKATVTSLRETTPSITALIEKTASHEPIPVSARVRDLLLHPARASAWDRPLNIGCRPARWIGTFTLS